VTTPLLSVISEQTIYRGASILAGCRMPEVLVGFKTSLLKALFTSDSVGTKELLGSGRLGEIFA